VARDNKYQHVAIVNLLDLRVEPKYLSVQRLQTKNVLLHGDRLYFKEGGFMAIGDEEHQYSGVLYTGDSQGIHFSVSMEDVVLSNGEI